MMRETLKAVATGVIGRVAGRRVPAHDDPATLVARAARQLDRLKRDMGRRSARHWFYLPWFTRRGVSVFWHRRWKVTRWRRTKVVTAESPWAVVFHSVQVGPWSAMWSYEVTL